MADFAPAFAATMKAEGGYVNDPQDPGGETYKGIARKMNSKWDGWILIDLARKEKNFPANLDNNAPLQDKINHFYEVNYWHKIRCHEINDQSIAASLFDFAVNAGTVSSAKLAQFTVGAAPDGVIGTDTLNKINAFDPRTFNALFALNKIARYMHICEQRQDSKKFFYGWVRRTLEGIKS
jgi:lysozyme family protein